MAANVIGTEEFRSSISNDYSPKNSSLKDKQSSGTPFDDLVKNPNPDINTFTRGEGSQLEKDIKKTVRGIQEMVLAYVKGRVPLGDDKFNTTDMLRSMLDMLNATGNMQRASMQEDSNKMQLQQIYLLMCQQVGKDALVKDSKLTFKGKPTTFAVEIPKEGVVQVALFNRNGDTIKAWELDGEPGIRNLSWDGIKEEGGEAAEEGEYFIHAALSNGEESIIIPTYTQKRIEQVRFDPSNNSRFPIYYSGNQPIKNMLSVYSNGEPIASPTTTEVA